MSSALTHQILKSRSGNIFLVKSTIFENQKAWWFVNVSPGKLAFFETQCRREGLDLADYGQIIRSGYGENPPAEVIEELRSQWGWRQ